MKTLIEYINESPIYEMVLSMSNFRLKLYNLSEQLIQNWCLVKLCDLYTQESFSINRNHWCSELKSYIYNISHDKVKSGKKIKIIKHVLIDELELNDSNEVSKRIRSKFNDENLEKYINIISEVCSKNINNICNILDAKSDDEITDYLSYLID